MRVLVSECNRSMKVGDHFNLLTVKEGPFYLSDNPKGVRRQRAIFECKCGNFKEIDCYSVAKGHTTSCGCEQQKSRLLAKRKGTLIDSQGNKICSKCLTLKNAEQAFDKDKGRPDGFCGVCKDCRLLVQILRDYGITLEEYQSLLDKQEGKCACCGLEAKLVIDHCHTTGETRGLLCGKCNLGIGQFDDSPQKLRLAADYLEKRGLTVAESMV